MNNVISSGRDALKGPQEHAAVDVPGDRSVAKSGTARRNTSRPTFRQRLVTLLENPATPLEEALIYQDTARRLQALDEDRRRKAA